MMGEAADIAADVAPVGQTWKQGCRKRHVLRHKGLPAIASMPIDAVDRLGDPQPKARGLLLIGSGFADGHRSRDVGYGLAAGPAQLAEAGRRHIGGLVVYKGPLALAPRKQALGL